MHLHQYFTDFLTGVRPTTNYFVIFQPGSDQLLSNFVIFYHHLGLYISQYYKFKRNPLDSKNKPAAQAAGTDPSR